MIDMGYNLERLKEIAEPRSKEAIDKAKERKSKRLIWNNIMNENKLYILVQWPKSQMLMEHPRFNECLFVQDIEGHNEVGSSAYMCPINLYEEIFKLN